MFPELTRDDVFRLETRRLWLRWPRRADVPALVRQAGDKQVAAMTARIPHPYGPEAAESFVLAARSGNEDGSGLTLAITPRGDPGALIGAVGIESLEGRPELGYWVGTAHWGEGFVTEAARALLDAFFAYANGREVFAAARAINGASRRVLEKCGFSPVGARLRPFPARGGVFPVDEYRLDRRAWESFKAWSTEGFVPPASRRPGAAALP